MLEKKGDPFAYRQKGDPLAEDVAVMHENVFPIFGVDVAVPFRAIKPAHHAGRALRQGAASRVLQRRNAQISFVVKSNTRLEWRQFGTFRRG